MRRLLSLGTAAGLSSLCLLLIGFAGSAVAAPTVGFDVAGTADQSLSAIAPGAGGSVWVQQKVSGSAFELSRFSASGDLLATSAEISSDADGPLASAPDGSVWVAGMNGTSVQRVAADGTTATFALPEGALQYGGEISTDADSNAWVINCSYDPDTSERPCFGTSVSPTGAFNSVKLPDFDFSNGIHGYPSPAIEIIPVSGGVWFGLDQWVHNFGTSYTSTAFVSSGGAVTSVPLQGNSRLVAAGPDGKAWWMNWSTPASDADTRTMTVGQVTQDANVLPVSDAIEGDFYNTPPLLANDAGGNLLFAFNHTTTSGWVGDFTNGVAKVTGVPALTKVFSPQRDCSSFYFHAACEYGKTIYRTADGSIWTLAAPDERQVGRLDPSGNFTRFSPLTGESGALTVEGMTQSTDGAIWFALELADGSHVISRANPADPPAGESAPAPTEPVEPPAPPVVTPGGTVTGKSAPTAAASQDELDAIAESVRDGIGVWRSKKFSPKVAIQFPRGGRLDITVRSGKTVLAKVAKSHSPGPHLMRVKVGTAGRMLLKRKPAKASLSAKITVVFSTAGRKQASYTLHVRL